MTRKASDYAAGAWMWQTTGKSAYDIVGRVIGAWDGNGNKTTHRVHDELGRADHRQGDHEPALNQTATTTLDPERGSTSPSTPTSTAS